MLKFLCVGTLIASLFLVSGCSKDSDPTPSDIIVGTWAFSTINATITVGTQSLVAYFKSQGLSEADAQLYADQLVNSYKGDISGTLEIKKGGTWSSTDDQGNISTGKWELTSDGKTLTLDKGAVGESIFTITTLTSSKLIISSDVSDTDSGITFNVNLQIELTRK